MPLLPKAHMPSFLVAFSAWSFLSRCFMFLAAPASRSLYCNLSFAFRVSFKVTQQFHSERPILIYITWLSLTGTLVQASVAPRFCSLPVCKATSIMDTAEGCCWARIEPHPLELGLQQALRTCAGDSGEMLSQSDETKQDTLCSGSLAFK